MYKIVLALCVPAALVAMETVRTANIFNEETPVNMLFERLQEAETPEQFMEYFGEFKKNMPWRLAQTYHEHEGQVCVVDVSKNGKYIATGAADGTVVVWDCMRSKVVHRLDGQRGSINAVHFSPDGNHLVSASQDGTACLWDVGSGKLLQVFRKDRNNIFATDTKCTPQQQLSWEKEINTPVMKAEFSPNGRSIVTLSKDGIARVWARQNGRLLYELRSVGVIYSVKFSPDNTSIVTASHDGTVRIWDAASGECLNIPQQENVPIDLVEFSQDGHYLITVAHTKVTVLDQTTLQRMHTIDENTCISLAAMFPEHGYIVTVTGINTVCIRDFATGHLIHTLQEGIGWISSIELSADGTLLLVVSGGAVHIWDIYRGELLTTLPVATYSIRAARFIPRYNRIVMVSDEHLVNIWTQPDVDAFLDQLQQAVGAPARASL